MVTWLPKSTVTKYSSQTHVPDFKHKVFSNQNTKNNKSVLSLLSTQKIKRPAKFPSKHYTESCISLKTIMMEIGLIKLISNKQAKWLTYRISWCNVRIKLGQSLWAWRAFTKCLPLLNRQRRDKSAWGEAQRPLEKTQQSHSEAAL